MFKRQQNKLKPGDMDLTQIKCCNTCLDGKRKYDIEGDIPIGIRCLEKQSNYLRFDFVCDFYRPDIKFIEQNKGLRALINSI